MYSKYEIKNSWAGVLIQCVEALVYNSCSRRSDISFCPHRLRHMWHTHIIYKKNSNAGGNQTFSCGYWGWVLCITKQSTCSLAWASLTQGPIQQPPALAGCDSVQAVGTVHRRPLVVVPGRGRSLPSISVKQILMFQCWVPQRRTHSPFLSNSGYLCILRNSVSYRPSGAVAIVFIGALKQA